MFFAYFLGGCWEMNRKVILGFLSLRKNIYDFLEIYNPEILTLGSILIKSDDKYYLNNNFLQIYVKLSNPPNLFLFIFVRICENNYVPL